MLKLVNRQILTSIATEFSTTTAELEKVIRNFNLYRKFKFLTQINLALYANNRIKFRLMQIKIYKCLIIFKDH